MTTGGGPSTNTARVLQVNGDYSVAKRVENALSADRIDVEVVTERDPDTALTRLRTAEWDCFVSGYEFSETNGIDLLDQAREITPDLPVILFVENGTEAIASRAITAGVADYVRQDVEGEGVEHLVSRVRAVLEDAETASNPSPSDNRVYREVFEAVGDGLVVHDPETGDILDVNDRYCELTGYTREELVGSGIDIIVGSDDGDATAAARQKIEQAREEGAQLFEFDGQRKDGSLFTGEIQLSLVELRGRERVLASVRDITERKRREREYEQIFNGVNDAIVVQDPETAEPLDANQTFLDRLGYDDVEEIRREGHDGLSAADAGYTRERAKELCQRVLETGEPETVEWVQRTKSGDICLIEATVVGTTLRGQERILSIQRDITEQRRTERRLRAIVERIDQAIYLTRADEITDPTLADHDLSAGYKKVWGRPLPEIFDNNEEGFIATLHPDERSGFEAFIERMGSDIDEGTMPDRYSREYRIRRPDGEFRWIRSEFYPTEWETGPLRLVTVSRDITDRKRRERAIRALQVATERFQSAETRDEVASIALESVSEMLDLPMAVCWFTASEPTRLQPTAATDRAREAGLVSELSPDRYEYDVFENGTVTEYNPSKHAAENPLETGVLLPLMDHGLIAAGSETERHMNETILDIAQALADHATTALDRIERARAVRESERRFRLIAERIDEVILLASEDFSETLYVNPAYETVWGRPVENLREDAREFVEGVDPRDREAFVDELEAMVADLEQGTPDDSYSFEYRIRRPNGELRWISATGYAVELPGGGGRFIGIAEDITQRKQREQRLEVFNRILRHNLRNQLDVIMSHAEVLADRSDDSHAERILAAATELSEMGARARATDRIMSTDDEVTTVDVSETLRTIVESVDPEQGTDVRTTLPPSATIVTNDSALRTAVRSALENAIRYADSVATVRLEDGSGELDIVIEDDGPGIPDDELVPIRVGSETEFEHGRGLGLWQLRWSVDALGGELAFDTTAGTTIRITIPDQDDGEDQTLR